MQFLKSFDGQPGSIRVNKCRMMNDYALRTDHPHFIPNQLYIICCWLLLATALSGCRKESNDNIPLHAAVPPPLAAGTPAPSSYLLESHPFSPTLAHLFDQGQIVVFPAAATPVPPDPTQAQEYAFSAVDRYGKLYHFDRRCWWWMAEGQNLPQELPEGQWSAAWNSQAQALEVLVTGQYRGSKPVRLLRWREGRWHSVETSLPPMARRNSRRLFHAPSNSWIVTGGVTDRPMNDAWILTGKDWQPWAGTGTAAPVPDFTQVHSLIDGPAGAGIGLLTQGGDLWRFKNNTWARIGLIKMEGLRLAFYIPDQNKVLLVWEGKTVGEDRIVLFPLDDASDSEKLKAVPLNLTGMVKINKDDEGIWKAWGRVLKSADASGTVKEVFTPSFAGIGEPAIQISGEYGDAVFPRSQIKMIEMPPRLHALKSEAAAYVPAIGGVVVPTNEGLGIQAGQRNDFFPPEADADTSNSAGRSNIFVINRTYRFWIFKSDFIQWIKPPFDLHPAIGFTASYHMGQDERFFSWSFPEPGLLRYEYHEITEKNRQWIPSDLLSIRGLPQISWTPEKQLFLCDPVVWGNPAEVVLIGWCGNLSEMLDIEKPPENFSKEAYEKVPTQGFMARISALKPNEWKVSELPIPFCTGARVVVDTSKNCLYLVGGKIAEPSEINGRKLSFLNSNQSVWQWDGENWARIEPGGDDPRMKVTSTVAFDPLTNHLLALTPRALYAFDAKDWHSLWERDKVKGEQWPEEMGLYVHPASQLILGAWFMPRPVFRVWQRGEWAPVTESPEVTAATQDLKALLPGGPLPNNYANIIPAMVPDSFISIDATQLAAMRMDLERNRDNDRQIQAHWLTFQSADTPLPLRRWSSLDPDPGMGGDAATTATVKLVTP